MHYVRLETIEIRWRVYICIIYVMDYNNNNSNNIRCRCLWWTVEIVTYTSKENSPTYMCARYTYNIMPATLLYKAAATVNGSRKFPALVVSKLKTMINCGPLVYIAHTYNAPYPLMRVRSVMTAKYILNHGFRI